jgi:heat shock protein HslJ
MTKITLTIITLLVASGLILSACASKGASASLAGTSWKLVSYGPVGKQIPAAPGIKTSLGFGADGKVSGNVGCNQFSGNYEVKEGKIIFGLLASTLMACSEPQMTQESTSFQLMTGTVSFEVKGNTLAIYDASDGISIKFSGVENK